MTDPAPTREFTCARCHRTFECEWTEKEALAEFHENFPEVSKEDTVEICDDCYKEFRAWAEQEGILSA